MTDSHTKSDQILESLLTGTRTEDDPEIKAALDASPELRTTLSALQRRAQQLDAVGLVERQLVDSELTKRPAPYDIIKGHRPSATRRPYIMVAAAAAAAALIWLGTSGWFGESKQPAAAPGDLYLAPLAEGEMTPREFDSNDDELVFRWGFEASTGGSFLLEFYDAAEPSNLSPLLEIRIEGENSWRPTSEQRARLRPNMSWRVSVLGPDRRPTGSGGEQPLRRR